MTLELFLEEPAAPQPSSPCQPKNLWEQTCLDLSVLVLVLFFFFCFGFLASPIEQWSPKWGTSKTIHWGAGRTSVVHVYVYLINNKYTYIGNMCSKFFSDGMNSQNSLETTALEESCSSI